VNIYFPDEYTYTIYNAVYTIQPLHLSIGSRTGKQASQEKL